MESEFFEIVPLEVIIPELREIKTYVLRRIYVEEISVIGTKFAAKIQIKIISIERQKDIKPGWIENLYFDSPCDHFFL